MTPDAFLAAFFGAGNDIDLPTPESNPQLRALADDVLGGLRYPAVLPRRRGDRVDWFVLCADDPTLRQTQSEVQAFIGPSYARWDGPRATLDGNDPIERAVLDFVGARVLRFRTDTDAEFTACWNAVKLMRSLWRQRPSAAVEPAHSGASLLREFELGIAAGNAAGARLTLGELRRRGLLGDENLRFLEVRLLAAEGRWSDIAGAPDLADLAKVRRPWLVTEDLITALYQARLHPFELGANTSGALAAMRQTLDQVPALFQTRGPLTAPEVVKAFALRRALPPAPDPVAVRQLASQPGLSEGDRGWLSAIADSIDRPSAQERSARDLLASGDIDGAFALARTDPAGRARTELLIECAYELQTLAAAVVALEALDGSKPAERAAILERRLLAIAITQLEELRAGPHNTVAEPPATWTDWLRRLLAEPQWPVARAVAACGELEYSAMDLEDPDSAGALPGLVVAVADSPQRQVLFDSLPRIVGWLDRNDLGPGAARPVHEAILTAIALDTARSASSLEVAYNAAEALLVAGLTEAGYADLLDQLALTWERMASRAHAAWLCDLLELLVLHPGPRDRLLGFVAAAVAPLLALARQLDQDVLDTLASVVDELGAATLAEQLRGAEVTADHVDLDHDVLRGRLVGIYTLTPQVGLRARDAVRRRFPSARVEVDSSYVSTPALEHLAVAADYLIVSIRSAKHAATDAIDRNRPREKPTLIPRGRGSSRMVEALVEALAADLAPAHSH
jgi:hypothetical protein